MKPGNSTASVDLLVQRGKVVSKGLVSSQWVAVKDGRVVALGCNDGWIPEAKQVVDATNKFVLPGIIDNEHHPSEAVYDLFLAETRAAISGGITTVGIETASVDFTQPSLKYAKPEQVPLFMDVMPNVRQLESGNHVMADYFYTPVLSKPEHVQEIPELAAKHGITSFKLRLHTKAGEHIWDMWQTMKVKAMYYYDDGMVYSAMRKIAALGPPCILGLHCENWEIAYVRRAELMSEGRQDPGAWDDMSPAFCEAGHIRTYAYYAKITGCPILIRHTTCEESFEEIRKAREEGVQITGNTNPHYLTIDKNIWRTNVPHRPRETFPKIWEAVRTGIIDTISSDSIYRAMSLATIEEWEAKNGPIAEVGAKYPHPIFAGAGEISRDAMAGRTEGMLYVLLSEGVNKGRISLERLVEVCCENPARKFGLYPKKGVIAVGADADFVIVDLNKTMKLTRDQIFNSNGWSIWEGWEIKGWPVMTILRGNIMMEWPDGEPKRRVVGKPIGRYLARKSGHELYPLD